MNGLYDYRLTDVCSRLSSGKSISSGDIFPKGTVPVYGGNGLRGYTSKANFTGECAIVGRQGAFCGNVRYFSGEAYMTEHAVVVCANERHNTRYLAYLQDNQHHYLQMASKTKLFSNQQKSDDFDSLHPYIMMIIVMACIDFLHEIQY